MSHNQFGGFDGYNGFNNGFPHCSPNNFMQTEPGHQMFSQQLPMEQFAGPGLDPNQENIVEEEVIYDEIPQEQDTTLSCGNTSQNLSRLQMNTPARELREKVKQTKALRQTILKPQAKDCNPKNTSEMSGLQARKTETEKPATELPITPRVIKQPPVSTYPIPVYCPESPQGHTHIQYDMLDNTPQGPEKFQERNAQASCAKECGERETEKPMASSRKTEEHKDTKNVEIPWVATDGDLGQDVVLWLQQTGFYDNAKRTPVLARWKELAKTEKDLARLQ
ncbi:hypothetical protein PpBr36_08513 [Pyricularia pennisetigena]|uniref:hypothetical protein n=1 Tax=Pyricularia pennisetigena TaxID=1578925 RepID=UPI001154DA83|nr:hypothetical protein PpBr36_08513 [Pyricularia pennisetigena]TLS24089.1 hypothetical protein PpBr36_08513 [Pyricularia pennisetigena]